MIYNYVAWKNPFFTSNSLKLNAILVLRAYIWVISRQHIKIHIKPNSPFSAAVVQGSYRFFIIIICLYELYVFLFFKQSKSPTGESLFQFTKKLQHSLYISTSISPPPCKASFKQYVLICFFLNCNIFVMWIWLYLCMNAFSEFKERCYTEHCTQWKPDSVQ